MSYDDCDRHDRMKMPGVSWLFIFAGSLGAGASERDWQLNGYAKEQGREWFSMRGPGGESWWVSEGRPGPVIVKSFNPETGVLTAEVDGQTREFSLVTSRIGEVAMPIGDAISAKDVVAFDLPPLPVEEPGEPASRKKFREAILRIQAGVMAERIERSQTSGARVQVSADSSEKSRKTDAGLNARSNVSLREYWAEVYRKVAEQRQIMAAREEEERKRRLATAP